MKKTHIISIATLTTLLLLSLCSFAHANWVKSVNYPIFNSTAQQAYVLDNNYTSWVATIHIGISFNATSSGKNACIQISDGNLSVTPTAWYYLEFRFKKDNSYYIYLFDHSASSIDLAEGLWNTENDTYIEMSDGLLSIGTTDNTTSVIDCFAIGEWDVQYIGASGATDTATAGFVTVDMGISYSMGTGSVTAWMPLIIQFAMLGVILGLLKKFGKF